MEFIVVKSTSVKLLIYFFEFCLKELSHEIELGCWGTDGSSLIWRLASDTTIDCFLVFTFGFYFLQRYCTKVAPLCVMLKC
jgi:hypothetical protein